MNAPLAGRWPALMDKATAAEYLTVSEATIARLAADGDLVTVQVRSLARYPRAELDAYIERIGSAA